MNETKQKIAIAEFCGWKFHDHPDVINATKSFISTRKELWCMDPKGELCWVHDLPDYLNDLNALHEAELMLMDQTPIGETTLEEYEDYISLNADFAWHATATQKAEALLRVTENWGGNE